MTIDANVRYTDEAFLEDIDEIIEDTMIQMFFLQPEDSEALEKAKAEAKAYSALFYTVPAAFKEHADENCIGYRVATVEELESIGGAEKPLFINESDLDDVLLSYLKASEFRGVILNARQPHESLERFFVSIGPDTVGSFDTEQLSAMPMDRLMLQSGYPDYDFEAITSTVKVISDAMFRPEQSIIARATKNALTLTGFKK